MPTGTIRNPALAQELLNALDALSGLHPGFRPAHAKGLMCSGTFTPLAEAAKLTRAPHATAPSTPVTVRYSDGTGVPNIPDNDPARSGPRGIAIRFHLGDHAHTDIIAHSTNGFPVRTGEEFCSTTVRVPRRSAGRSRLPQVESAQPKPQLPRTAILESDARPRVGGSGRIPSLFTRLCARALPKIRSPRVRRERAASEATDQGIAPRSA